MSEKEPLLRVERLYRSYRSAGLLAPGSSVRAVDDVSLCIGRGETYGLVGESGCGKSTLGRCILRLIEPDAGQAFFEGEDFLKLRGRRVRSLRRRMQMVFQDPYLSLDPKMRIGSALMEALAIHGMGSRKERFDRAMTLLLRMGFSPEHFFRFPHEFSGGQRQRIGLARALILEPSLIVCDEPVSALDVSVQAQIINLMKDIQEERGVSYLFIAHNLSVVRYISTGSASCTWALWQRKRRRRSFSENPRIPTRRLCWPPRWSRIPAASWSIRPCREKCPLL